MVTKLKKLLNSKPNTIKVKLTEEQRKEIANLVVDECNRIDGDRSEEMANWDLIIDMYNTKSEPKDFPYKNASNIVLPIIAAHCNGIKARVKKYTFNQRPLFFAEQYNASETETAKEIERALDFILRDIDIKDLSDSTVFEAILLGTGIGRLSLKQKMVKKYKKLNFLENPTSLEDFYNNLQKEDVQKALAKGSKRLKTNYVEYTDVEKKINFEYIALKNFYIDKYVTDVEDARFHGHKYWLRWNEIVSMVNTADWQDTEKLLGDRDPVEDKEMIWKEDFEFISGILYYDVDDDGFEEKIIVNVGRRDRVLVDAIFCPYEHGQSFYHIFRIHKKPGYFYGLGVGEKLLEINDASNTLFNQSIDSTTVRTAPTFAARTGGTFDPTAEEWYPGKVFWLKDPKNDLIPYYVPGSAAESINMTMFLQRSSEQLTGFSSYMTGRESPTDPTAPASKTMALLAEANINIAEYLDNLSATWNKIAVQIAGKDGLIQQYWEEFKYISEDEKGEYDGTLTKEMFQASNKFTIQATGYAVNKSLERQEISEMYKIMRNDPMVQRNPKAVVYLMDLFIRSYGIEWEKHSWKLLPTLAQLEEQIPQENAQVMEEFVNSLKAGGATDQQIAQMVARKTAEMNNKTPQVNPVMQSMVGTGVVPERRARQQKTMTKTGIKRDYRQRMSKELEG